jgi:hypothetical protein
MSEVVGLMNRSRNRPEAPSSRISQPDSRPPAGTFARVAYPQSGGKRDEPATRLNTSCETTPRRPNKQAGWGKLCSVTESGCGKGAWGQQRPPSRFGVESTDKWERSPGFSQTGLLESQTQRMGIAKPGSSPVAAKGDGKSIE